jgi:hypothetical protein
MLVKLLRRRLTPSAMVDSVVLCLQPDGGWAFGTVAPPHALKEETPQWDGGARRQSSDRTFMRRKHGCSNVVVSHFTW